MKFLFFSSTIALISLVLPQWKDPTNFRNGKTGTKLTIVKSDSPVFEVSLFEGSESPSIPDTRILNLTLSLALLRLISDFGLSFDILKLVDIASRVWLTESSNMHKQTSLIS